jgi:hypothetical protein
VQRLSSLRALRCEQLETRRVFAGFEFASVEAFGDGNNPASVLDIALDPAGNSYRHGYFTGTIDLDPGQTHTGNVDILTSVGPGRDLFVAKYDAADTLLWAKRLGSNVTTTGQEEAGADIAVGSDGGVYFAGKFRDSLQVDAFELTSAGESDGFLVKLDSDGTTAWATRFGAEQIEKADQLALGSAGQVYVVGTVDIDTHTVVGSVEIMQFNAASGELDWSKLIDSGSGPAMVAVDASGNLNIAGYFFDPFDADPGAGETILDHGEESRATASTFVLQLDSAGGFNWARTFEAHTPIDPTQISFAFGQRMIVDTAGNILVFGDHGGRIDFDPSASGSTELGPDVRAFVVKLDNDGNYIWARGVEGSSNFFFRGLATDSEDNIVAAGYVRGYGEALNFDPGATNATLVPLNASGSLFDSFVWSLSEDGEFRSLTHIASAGDSVQATGLAIDATNDLRLVGSFSGTVDFNPSAQVHELTSAARSVFYLRLELNDSNDPPPTKFYVVNDATQNLTYEYSPTGALVESYGLNGGNTAPRGAASTAAGDRTWVIDANKKVYVYSNSGALLGSWTTGSLASNATVEGIATNGTDIWIVDARQDRVYRYAGAATRVSGSQNAASSFALNSGNTSPKDIVTNGTHVWVVNDSSTDKVFKYTVSGSLVGSWTITSGGGSPTGITIDPVNVSDIWIVDSNTDRVYQYTAAASRTSGSQSSATSFALAAGNTNPQGIADPPAPAKAESLTGFPTRGSLSRHPSQAHIAAAIDQLFSDDSVWTRKSRINLRV